MDEDLKRRLIGAAIVSLLLIVIVPYFFEDKGAEKGEALPEAMMPQSLALPGAVESSGAAVAEPTDPGLPAQAPPQAAKKRKSEMVPLTDEAPAKALKVEPVIPKDVPPPAEADEEPVTPLKPLPRVSPAGTSAPEGNKSSKPSALKAPALASDHAATVGKPKSSSATDREKPAVKKADPAEASKPTPHPPEAGAKAPKKAVSPAQDPVKKSSVAITSPPVVSHPTAYIVQAGTFSDENNARNLAEKIKKRNLPVKVQTIETSTGKIYRVTVGPGFDHQKAEQVQKQLSEQDGVKGMILQTH